LNLIRVMPAKGQGLAPKTAPLPAEPGASREEYDVQASIFLGRLLGPLFPLPGAFILTNPRVFRTVTAEVVGSMTLVYLSGLVDLAAGLAKVIRNERIYPVTGAVAVILGLIFCYFGYRA
jgi:hypothetical protein